MPEKFDLVVIGVGMAGLNAAKKCANGGLSVAVVDERPYGGTCALRGCDPKKMLRRAAEVVEAARLMGGKGVGDTPRIEWADLMAHKRSFTDPVPGKMESALDEAGVITLHGTARFIGPTALRIAEREVEAGKVLIATGQRPRSLDVPGAEHLTDSTEFLELEELPRRILFVGGGYVSMEFAHIAARAGASVTVADRGQRPLKAFDPDLVHRLVESSKKAGIDFVFGASLAKIERRGGSLFATLDWDEGSIEIEADLVVNGAGRVPEIGHLNLEAANVAHADSGITVTEHLRSTTNQKFYAAGDCAATGGPPLTPVAVHEGAVAASNILKGDHRTPDYAGVPSVAFTLPEIVRIGVSEEDARRSGRDVNVRFNETSGWYSNQRIGAKVGATKLIVDKATDELLGVHLLGYGQAEVANLFGLAMRSGLKATDLQRMQSAYPTHGSDLSSMLS
ncbi:dihydrolipoyl dehydrogenase family protein [Parvularcula oceani]|uniref:dihydrolipoyl dehydrogenase family protein n=1 Tax=Parvularcula oceani TaxID=1247963 RepID=UPI0004E1AA2C|nr:NAD(P)/FAD-dependent oxidoreductase [Parvularcula oceani]